LAYAYQDVNFDPRPEAVLETAGDLTTVNARAGLLTYGVGAMADLGNGFESTRQYTYNETLDRYAPVVQPWEGFVLGNRTLIRDRDTDEVWMLSPPDLSKAACVVGLDGTPTMILWNTVFNQPFRLTSILTRPEWRSYLTDAVNIDIRQTNDSPKSYFNPNNVTPPKDTKIAFWIWVQEGEKPGLITSKTALQEYEDYNDGETFEYVSDKLNFGGVRSYNGYKDKTLGYVTGSRHYGDDYIKQWAALMGYAVDGERVGDDRVYGEIGDQIRDQMRVETVQDVLRFGRGNEDRTRVYVNTSVLPEWSPSQKVHGTLRSETYRDVMTYMIERSSDEPATVQEVSHETNISTRHARQLLNDLAEDGYVTKTKEEGFGTKGRNLYEWDS
jgi:predicted transcriptional regulator